MVLAIVHPACVGVAAGEGLAVPLPDEVLRRRAAGRSARVDVADKHPVGVALLVLEREEVGAFPYARVAAVVAAKGGEIAPVLQVIGGIESHFLPTREHKVPLLGLFVPEEVGVAEVGYCLGDDRVSLVLGEGLSVVGAICQCLALPHQFGRCVHRHHGSFSKARGTLMVDDGRAGEDCSYHIGLQRHRLVLPMDKVGGGGVSPTHVLPQRAIGVVLVVEMPNAIAVEHAVGVVHPTVEGRMVVLGAIRVIVGSIKGIR